MTEEQTKKYYQKFLFGEKVRLKSHSQLYTLINENGKWKIDENIVIRKKLKDLWSSACGKLGYPFYMSEYIDEKKIFEKLDGYKAQKPKFEKVLKEFPKHQGAKDAIKRLKHLIKIGEIYKDCLSKVKVKNIEVGPGQFGNTGFFGEVKNNSKHSLSKVEIKILFLNKNGQAVHEMNYHPVLLTSSEIKYSQEKLLKPNYVRKWGCKADSAPSDWHNKVKIEVIEIEIVGLEEV